MKLRNLLLKMFMILPVALNAGVILKGNITTDDSDGEVFSFAVIPADSVKKSMAGTIEGSMLNVELPFAGKARVEISSLGYDSYKVDVDLVDGVDYNLGTIKLVKNSIKLGEVVATGKKINIRRDGSDYTISNIQGTHLGTAGSLMDMLSWTPGVVVDLVNGKVEVVGAGTPVIYINNRKIVHKSELNALRSTMVSKIEVIRAPGAEYSSSAAAVIKIYTSKPLKDYLGATLSSISRFGRKYSNGTNLDLNMKAGAVSGNFSLFYGNSRSKYYDWERTDFMQEDGSMFKTSDYNMESHKMNVFLVFGGLNFQLGEKSVLGVQYSGEFSDINGNGRGQKSYNEGDRVIDKVIISDRKDNSKSHTASVSYVWNRTKNSTLTLVADYSSSPSDEYEVSTEKNATDGGYYTTDINTDKKYNIYTFNSDYTFSFLGKDKEKLGFGFYHVKSDGGTSIDGSVQGSVRKDTWYSAFYTFKRTWNKWNVELGLRYEYDKMTNVNYGNMANVERSYSDLLPTLRASYKLNDNYMLTAIYRRVISRPSYQSLDPTVYYSDSLNYSTGNPLLRPTYTDRYRLVLNVKSVSISAQYWRYKDEVIDVLRRKEPGSNIYVSMPENIDHSDAWMLNVDYSLSTKKFNMTLMGGLVLPYLKYAYMDGVRKVNRLFGNIYGNFSYRFNNHIVTFATASFRPQGDSGIRRVGSSCNLNAGIQVKLLDGNLNIRAMCNDLLRKGVTPWWEIRYNNMYQWHKNSYDTRVFTLNVSCTLNTLKTKFRKRGGSSDAFGHAN